MKRVRGFSDVLLASLIALVACALVWFVCFVVWGAVSTLPRTDLLLLLTISGVVVFYGLIVALPVLIIFAAPAYALLLRAGRASYATATIIGVIPGVVLLCINARSGVAAMVTGVVVSVATHKSCGGDPGESSKPDSLRGRT
ncbi:hypothetical protein [Xanthomonas sontii]|uniref:Uncharacterized protein n=1 Tax=Xanthomonas sontii TaxID=2650745 RepID=A0A6N7Q9X4_9XANT|nr:hypothetical protein [Xanthomonas sontii]MRH01193.1 hypothetical protein [Xanthomonas sontii]MRH75370.1 hypothetical protein [Xanthomonas sontii]